MTKYHIPNLKSSFYDGIHPKNHSLSNKSKNQEHNIPDFSGRLGQYQFMVLDPRGSQQVSSRLRIEVDFNERSHSVDTLVLHLQKEIGLASPVLACVGDLLGKMAVFPRPAEVGTRIFKGIVILFFRGDVQGGSGNREG